MKEVQKRVYSGKSYSERYWLHKFYVVRTRRTGRNIRRNVNGGRFRIGEGTNGQGGETSSPT